MLINYLEALKPKPISFMDKWEIDNARPTFAQEEKSWSQKRWGEHERKIIEIIKRNGGIGINPFCDFSFKFRCPPKNMPKMMREITKYMGYDPGVRNTFTNYTHKNITISSLNESSKEELPNPGGAKLVRCVICVPNYFYNNTSYTEQKNVLDQIEKEMKIHGGRGIQRNEPERYIEFRCPRKSINTITRKVRKIHEDLRGIYVNDYYTGDIVVTEALEFEGQWDALAAQGKKVFNRVYKNPTEEELRMLPQDARGIIESRTGNVFLCNSGMMLHGDIIKLLKKIHVLSRSISDVYKDLTLELDKVVRIQRQGNSNTMIVVQTYEYGDMGIRGISQGSYNIINKVLQKAKITNPHMEFVNNLKRRGV